MRLSIAGGVFANELDGQRRGQPVTACDGRCASGHLPAPEADDPGHIAQKSVVILTYCNIVICHIAKSA